MLSLNFKYSSAEYAQGFLNRDNIIISDFHLHCIPYVKRQISRVTSAFQLSPNAVDDVILRAYDTLFRKLDSGDYEEEGKFLAFFTSLAFFIARKGDPLKERSKAIKLTDPILLESQCPHHLTEKSNESEIADLDGLKIANVLPNFKLLNPDYQELMILHYEQGYSYEEITQITGRSISNIKVSFYRIRKQLRA